MTNPPPPNEKLSPVDEAIRKLRSYAPGSVDPGLTRLIADALESLKPPAPASDDGGGVPEPLPEVLPVGTRSMRFPSGHVYTVPASGARRGDGGHYWGFWGPKPERRETHIAPDEIDWSHYHRTQSTLPDSPGTIPTIPDGPDRRHAVMGESEAGPPKHPLYTGGALQYVAVGPRGASLTMRDATDADLAACLLALPDERRLAVITTFTDERIKRERERTESAEAREREAVAEVQRVKDQSDEWQRQSGRTVTNTVLLWLRSDGWHAAVEAYEKAHTLESTTSRPSKTFGDMAARAGEVMTSFLAGLPPEEAPGHHSRPDETEPSWEGVRVETQIMRGRGVTDEQWAAAETMARFLASAIEAGNKKVPHVQREDSVQAAEATAKSDRPVEPVPLGVRESAGRKADDGPRVVDAPGGSVPAALDDGGEEIRVAVQRGAVKEEKPQAMADPRPFCGRCHERWVPPEGVDATVTHCPTCRVFDELSHYPAFDDRHKVIKSHLEQAHARGRAERDEKVRRAREVAGKLSRWLAKCEERSSAIIQPLPLEAGVIHEATELARSLEALLAEEKG